MTLEAMDEIRRQLNIVFPQETEDAGLYNGHDSSIPVRRQVLSRINREGTIFPSLWIGYWLAVSKLTEYQIDGVSSLAFGILVDR